MEPLGVKKKQGSIVEILRDAILHNDIACDTELTQKEIADSLEVSRMPVREALILLEYQGLIRRLPNNHVKVVNFTKGYFSDIFQLGMQLEGKILQHMEKPETMMQLSELAVHREIYRNCQNQLWSKTLESITEIYLEYGIRNMQNSEENKEREEFLRMVLEEAEKKEYGRMEEQLQKYFSCMSREFEKREI